MTRHRRVGDKPFANNFRIALYTEVEQHPGVCFTQLHSAFPIGYGALGHHLHILIDVGLLTTVKRGQFRRYYTADCGLGDKKKAHALLQDPNFRRVYEAIRTCPGTGQTFLATQFPNVQRQTIAYRLRLLHQAGLITKTPNGKTVQYYTLNEPTVTTAIDPISESYLSANGSPRTQPPS